MCDNPVIFTASRGGQRAEEETGAADDGEASGTRGHAAGKPESEMVFFYTTFNTLSFLHQVEGMGPEKEESLPSSFILLLWSH